MATNDDRHVNRTEPTTDQPLNARPRPRVLPVVLLLLFVAAIALLWLFGLEVLVPAD